MHGRHRHLPARTQAGQVCLWTDTNVGSRIRLGQMTDSSVRGAEALEVLRQGHLPANNFRQRQLTLKPVNLEAGLPRVSQGGRRGHTKRGYVFNCHAKYKTSPYILFPSRQLQEVMSP